MKKIQLHYIKNTYLICIKINYISNNFYTLSSKHNVILLLKPKFALILKDIQF